jgi:hypothetical protein
MSEAVSPARFGFDAYFAVLVARRARLERLERVRRRLWCAY